MYRRNLFTYNMHNGQFNSMQCYYNATFMLFYRCICWTRGFSLNTRNLNAFFINIFSSSVLYCIVYYMCIRSVITFIIIIKIKYWIWYISRLLLVFNTVIHFFRSAFPVTDLLRALLVCVRVCCSLRIIQWW